MKIVFFSLQVKLFVYQLPSCCRKYHEHTPIYTKNEYHALDFQNKNKKIGAIIICIYVYMYIFVFIHVCMWLISRRLKSAPIGALN